MPRVYSDHDKDGQRWQDYYLRSDLKGMTHLHDAVQGQPIWVASVGMGNYPGTQCPALATGVGEDTPCSEPLAGDLRCSRFYCGLALTGLVLPRP